MSYLKKYFQKVSEGKRTSSAIAYMAALDSVASVDPEIAGKIVQELCDQRTHLKLIASENFCSLPVQLAMGNLLTDKYSEGFVGHRFYAGCENIDVIEGKANALAKELFGAEHAYVQPHSGADANLVAFWAILVQRVQSKEVERLGKKTLNQLSPEEYEDVRKLLVSQKIMGLGLSSGGHLTHGYRHNISAKMMQSFSYDVDIETGVLDYDALEAQVKQVKPLILVAGYSAYPRLLNFARMREIADTVGAVLMVDMAHFSGLVAGGLLEGDFNPMPFADIVTSTTHKTLRGPRGGIILCKEEFKDVVDKGCPLVLGGPLPHVMAAKALAFQEAMRPEFKTYVRQVVKNAKVLGETLVEKGVRVITGGTENHLLVFDTMTHFGLNGKQAEALFREAKLTVNRNTIPGDKNGPWLTSGVRMGTSASTTLGMKEDEMREIGSIIFELLSNAKSADPKEKATIDPSILEDAQNRVGTLLRGFPLYPELEIDGNCSFETRCKQELNR